MRARFFLRTMVLVLPALALVDLGTGFDPRWLSVDWSATNEIPFPVSGQLEIASRSRPFKQSSLALLCGPAGAHLMLKSRLPVPDEFRWRALPRHTFVDLRTGLIFDWVPMKTGIFIHSF